MEFYLKFWTYLEEFLLSYFNIDEPFLFSLQICSLPHLEMIEPCVLLVVYVSFVGNLLMNLGESWVFEHDRLSSMNVLLYFIFLICILIFLPFVSSIFTSVLREWGNAICALSYHLAYRISEVFDFPRPVHVRSAKEWKYTLTEN